MSLALDAENARPPSRLLLLMEGRALHELAAFGVSLPLLSLAPRGDGHPVLVLPGLVASDISTRPLRGFLRNHAYAAHGWKLGRNNGYFRGLEQQILDRVHDLRGRYGRKVSLVGWSLGGIFARQIAKLIPGDIRTVITLGSPFSGNPKATHAWRLYEFAYAAERAVHSSVSGGDLHCGSVLCGPHPQRVRCRRRLPRW